MTFENKRNQSQLRQSRCKVRCGEVVQRIEYDEFGRVLTDSAPGMQPFGFAGGLYDAETKLVRFGARDYASHVGRWIARDPVRFAGEEVNVHVYAENDCVNLVDAAGYCSVAGAIGSIGDFGRNYRDMRDANTIGGDKYFHCKANCESSKRGCSDLAESISDAREWLDENVKGDPHDACMADQDANRHGRENARSGESCSSTCNPYRPRGLPPGY
jgi:RHS repeat-associated protein